MPTDGFRKGGVQSVNAVRLQDIARELGLSVSTVSRALSGRGRVGERTRRRVQEAVRRSDYRVNEVARSLRTKSAKSIGIVVPDISNSFFAAVIKGAQQRCQQDGYMLIVCNSDEDPKVEAEMLGALLGKQVSGLVLAGVGDDRGLAEKCGGLGVPVVYIDNIPRDAGDCDSVSIDNYGAARRLTLSMLERGYREIGMITGPMSQSTGVLRRQGFEAVLSEQGIALRDEWILEGAFRMDSGFAQMNRILALSQRPRAMLFANNYIAYGALGAIRRAGLSVPGDIAFAAFDAADPTGLISPVITSVNQPAEQIGLRAADMLLERMSRGASVGRRVLLEPLFVDGDSW